MEMCMQYVLKGKADFPRKKVGDSALSLKPVQSVLEATTE